MTSSTDKGSSAKKDDRGAMSFRAWGEEVIRQRIGKLLSYTRAVRRGNDPDALHDMRVASRRLRAALNVFAEAFECPDYGRLQKEMRQVTAALSRARDLDVMIAGLQKDAARLPASQRSVISDVIREWTAERRRAQGDVVAILDRLTASDIAGVFEGIVAATAPASEERAVHEP